MVALQLDILIYFTKIPPFPILMDRLLLLLAAISSTGSACIAHVQDQSIVGKALATRQIPALGKTAITNVQVFDGISMTPPRTIFIDGEHIVDSSTAVTNTIDASGQFLIPGLVDSHLHLSSLSN